MDASVDSGGGRDSEAEVMTSSAAPADAVEASVPSSAVFGDEALMRVLIEQGALTQEDVDTARMAMAGDDTAGSLLEVVIGQKELTEDVVQAAWSQLLDMPQGGSLKEWDIPDDLITGLPINFAKHFKLVPLQRMDDGRIRVACANPIAVGAFDDLSRLLGGPLILQLAGERDIVEAINRAYDRGTAHAAAAMEKMADEDLDSFAHDFEEAVDLLDAEDEAPIIRLVNSLVSQAVKEHASDIHIEPGERELVVRFRIDGVLYEKIRPPKKLQAAINSRIKIQAGLNIAEKRLPQDGRIRLKIAGKDIDIRVATAPTSYGERITMRLLDRSSVLLDLTDLGFSKDTYDVMSGLSRKSHGIILVTGPTGSGKTTSLYACLSSINRPDLNILTIEDPVEYQLDGISQTQVNAKINLTFASGLRSFLRHDPDVIMVGEIRDLETAEIAIQAALTGHLVLSTIHTNDAPGAITRLVDMGVEPFLVASSVVGILAQRLVRTVCPACKQAYAATDEEIRELGLSRDMLGPAPQFWRGEGCAECFSTGYQGRTGIYELLTPGDEVRNLILENVDSNTIKRKAMTLGMRTLREDGARKVLAGMTTSAEVLRVTAEDAT